MKTEICLSNDHSIVADLKGTEMLGGMYNVLAISVMNGDNLISSTEVSRDMLLGDDVADNTDYLVYGFIENAVALTEKERKNVSAMLKPLVSSLSAK